MKLVKIEWLPNLKREERQTFG